MTAIIGLYRKNYFAFMQKYVNTDYKLPYASDRQFLRNNAKL